MNKNILSFGKKVTGLYIGHGTVDLVVLKGTLKGPKLIKFGQTYIYPQKKEEEITPETMDGDAVKSEPQKDTIKKTRDDYIVEAINRVLKENNVRPGNVITALSSEEVMVRYFQMPKMPKQEWSSAINFEAKRYIPFRMEDVASDFQVLQRQGPSDSMDVVFSAVKQNAIEHIVTLFERANVRPIVIEPAPFSFIRAFNAAGQINSRENTAIINIDIKTANITLLRNGVPYIIRDIPLGEGASEDKSLEPVFEKLLAEIKLSFDFYEKQFPSEVMDKIIIYSHLPLENWHELVGRELQVSVEVGDPLRGIRLKKDIVPPKLAIAFGLALRGLSEPFIEVNLYREKWLTYRSKGLFLRAIFLGASIAVFSLIILKVACMRAITPLSKELSRTLSERPKVEVSIKDDSIGALERLKNKMDAKRILLKDVLSSRTYFTGRLTGLARLVPDNIWLSDVDFNEELDKKDPSNVTRQLDIKGYCVVNEKVSETDAINDFLTDLKKGTAINKGMSKADIVSVEKTEINGKKVARFEILFTGP